MIDPALLRPGRFDRLLYVPLPDEDARKRILEIHLEGKPIGEDVNPDEIAKTTEGYTGADLAAAADTAVMFAIREHIDKYGQPKKAEAKVKELKVNAHHLKEALGKVRKIPMRELSMYEGFSKNFEGTIPAASPQHSI